MALAVIARYECAARDIADIRSALLEMREYTLNEPGNITYEVHEELDAEGVFILYEQYVDREGFDAHTRTPHFEEHINGFIKPRLRDRTVYFADVI